MAKYKYRNHHSYEADGTTIKSTYQDIEDTEQLEQFDDIDHDVDKPISIAMEQLLSDELNWKYTSEDEDSSI